MPAAGAADASVGVRKVPHGSQLVRRTFSSKLFARKVCSGVGSMRGESRIGSVVKRFSVLERSRSQGEGRTLRSGHCKTRQTVSARCSRLDDHASSLHLHHILPTPDRLCLCNDYRIILLHRNLRTFFFLEFPSPSRSQGTRLVHPGSRV